MKFIIWGHHPLHTSTHGYIHNTYEKAFRYLGYDVNWVPNSPDIDISNDSIEKLFSEIKKIKNFALFAPTYLDESIHKNYYKKFDVKDNFKDVLEVEWIDNSFIINKFINSFF
jgi:hypothetical protein